VALSFWLGTHSRAGDAVGCGYAEEREKVGGQRGDRSYEQRGKSERRENNNGERSAVSTETWKPVNSSCWGRRDEVHWYRLHLNTLQRGNSFCGPALE